jgi:hypothetical protein
MGRGAAQLGKAVKGKSKQRRNRLDKKAKVREGAAVENIHNDIAALEEYEKLNQLAEQQRKRLKSLAAVEGEYGNINTQLIHNIFRQFMRSEKIDSLRNEIEILAQNHIRDTARKDEIIKSLINELNETEAQFQYAQKAHMSYLHKYNNVHNNKLFTLEAEFQRDLKQIKEEFINERENISSNFKQTNYELTHIIQAIEAEELDKLNEAKQKHETEREEIRNKNLEGINELRINLENKIEDLERQFDDAHRNYVEATDAANQHFKRLKAEDAQLSLAIYEKKKKILKLQGLIQSWKKKLQLNLKEGTQRNELLKQQKEEILKHCRELKGKMQKFRQNEAKRLTELTLMARNALKTNQNKLQKAEKILLFAELARKYETEREKVLPFEFAEINISSLANPQSNAVHKINLETNSSENQLNGEESKEAAPTNPQSSGDNDVWNALSNFYSRYNKVLLDCLAVETEKKRLEAENHDLKAILQQYLDGVGVKSSTVDDENNSLLIVNGRLNLIQTQPAAQTQVRRARPNITQEAAQITANYALQRAG